MSPVLYVHDVYAVMGEHEYTFEDSVRDEYVPGLDPTDARLLWYLHATHGAGQAHHVVTFTALADGAAYERHVQRLRYGDLAVWRGRVEGICYSSRSSLLVAASWSPLSTDFESFPTGLGDSGVLVFREDTLEGPSVVADTPPPPPSIDDDILCCIAAFRPALAPDGMLRVLYRVAPEDRLAPALEADMGWDDWSGSVTPTLAVGVCGSRRLLRSAQWSPLA